MKNFIPLLLAFLLVFSLCSCKGLANGEENSSLGGEEPPVSSEVNSEEEKFNPDDVSVELKSDYDAETGLETAVITATDKDGNMLWKHECGSFEAMQFDNHTELGKHGENYYYCENGSVIALKLESGEVVWKNSAFDGHGVKFAFGDKAIYLCGYFGPDFFAVSYDGATLKRIATISDDYWGARQIEVKNTNVAVYFDSSNEVDAEGNQGGVFYINKNTYSVSREE